MEDTFTSTESEAMLLKIPFLSEKIFVTEVIKAAKKLGNAIIDEGLILFFIRPQIPRPDTHIGLYGSKDLALDQYETFTRKSKQNILSVAIVSKAPEQISENTFHIWIQLGNTRKEFIVYREKSINDQDEEQPELSFSIGEVSKGHETNPPAPLHRYL